MVWVRAADIGRKLPIATIALLRPAFRRLSGIRRKADGKRRVSGVPPSSSARQLATTEVIVMKREMVEQGLAIEPTRGLSKTISRLSLLTAVVASQAYLIHAIFFAHALTPVGVYVLDRQTHLHLLSGQIGSIQEVFHWDGVIPTMLISFLVFVVVWMAARGTAKMLASSGPRGSSGQTDRDQLAQAIAASDVSTGGIV